MDKYNVLHYKGYIGSVEFSADDLLLHGKVLSIEDLVTFESGSVKGLQLKFQAAVDDYIKTCQRLGKEPNKSFKGTFNVRVGPTTHKDATLEAAEHNISLNEYVKTAIHFALNNADGFRRFRQTLLT